MNLIDELEHLQQRFDKAQTESEREFYRLAAELVIRKLDKETHDQHEHKHY